MNSVASVHFELQDEFEKRCTENIHHSECIMQVGTTRKADIWDCWLASRLPSWLLGWLGGPLVASWLVGCLPS